MIKKLSHQTELYIFFAIVLMIIIIQLRSSQFFTSNNLVDLIRALVVPGIFSIGAMIVLISGGIDVSFPSIASFSMFVVSTQMLHSEASVWVMLLAGALIGLVLGSLNGFLIGYFQFPALIVTLGTTSLFTGILHGALGAMEKPVPQAMFDLGKSKLFTVTNPVSGLSSDMPVTVVFFIVIVLVAWFIMNKTMLGRGIYAMGGDITSARRSGFNVFGIQMFIYCFVGALAGLTGIIRASMILDCHPNNLDGMELTVIAACVLGGTRVNGGKGTIIGTLLGIVLITIISTSLILVGIPTYWQRVFMGAAILIGTGVSAKQAMSSSRKITSVDEEKQNEY